MTVDPDEVTEVGVRYDGGSILIRPPHSAYPTDQYIRDRKKIGQRVVSRRILVLSDWEEIQ